MRKDFSHFCGIDPSWTGKNPTALSIIDRDFNLVEWVYSDQLDELIETLTRYRDVLVGVDAPLIVENKFGHRENEREFLRYFSKFRLSLYPVNRNRYPFFFPELIYQRLKQHGFSFETGNIFEIYPHATIAILLNNGKVFHYKRSRKCEKFEKLSWLEARIKRFVKMSDISVPRNDLKMYEDFLDSIVCALTVRLALERPHLLFGDEKSGILLVLKPEAQVSNQQDLCTGGISLGLL